jgi:lipopolysaccharide export system permease protein
MVGTLSALLVFAALFFFIDFVRQLEHIGTKDFGLSQALLYVLLNLPQRLYDLAPSTILLGGLISLGAMASSSELIVMRTSGVTIFRIVRSVLQVGLLLAVCVAIAGEFIIPHSVSTAKNIRASAMDHRVLVGGRHGLWAREGNLYVNVKRVMPNMGLRGISVYELDAERQLTRSTYAKSAYFEGDHWVLRGLEHSEISKEGIKTSTSKREEWPTLVKTELFDVLRLEPEDMSALDLMQYSDYLEQNELDAVPYRLAFWIKIFLPFTCLVMLMVAMPLVFNATARSGGTGQRVVVGLMLGILFYVFNRAVNSLGVVYGLSPAFSAAIPLVLVATVALVLIRRIR